MDAAHTLQQRVPIGSLLVERGIIDADELERALAEQRRSGRRLGEILVGWGMLSWLSLAEALAAQWPEDLERLRVELDAVPEPVALEPVRLVEPDPQSEHPHHEPVSIEVVAIHEPGTLEPVPVEIQVVPEARAPEPAHVEPGPQPEAIEPVHLELAAAPEPEPEPEPEPAREPAPEPAFLVFGPGVEGWTLVERTGTLPQVGDTASIGDTECIVAKVARSPLPADRRPCVYLHTA